MNTLFDTQMDVDMPTKKGFLYCDGGSRGNPGPAAGAAVLYDEEKNIIATGAIYHEHQTNNYAEYVGLIKGLELAIEEGVSDLVVTLDSKLLVEQVNGNWKVKNANIKPLWEKVGALKEHISHVEILHTLRAGNKVADSLVNKELDRRR